MKTRDETSFEKADAGPVFVDSTGRSLGRVKLAGLGAFGLGLGYVSLLGIAFVGGADAGAPRLPEDVREVASRSVESSPRPPQSAGAHQPGG